MTFTVPSACRIQEILNDAPAPNGLVDDHLQSFLEGSCFRHFFDQVGACREESLQGLLISWAMPAAILPKLESLSVWIARYRIESAVFFDQASLVNGQGTLLGNSDREVHLLFREIPLMVKEDPQDSHHVLSHEEVEGRPSF